MKNPDLLPSNTILFLIQHMGETMTPVVHIQGEGMTDKYYAQSIYYSDKHFKNEIKDNRLYKTRIVANPNNLENFKL